jgi:hypothetical protein
VRNLAPGRHELRLTRDGFLENAQEISLGPDESRNVTVRLTADGSDPPKTSGRKKWIVPAVAGGALAALLPLRGTKPIPEPVNQPPTVSSISVLQPGDGGVGLQGATIFRFGATTADAESDAVSLTWTFGDGAASATGSEVTHVYGSSGTFTVRLTAQDAKGASTSTERAVQVRSMTGRWSGTITAGGQSIAFTLQLTQQQAGSAITGSYSDSKGAGSVARSGISDTRAVSLTIGQGNLTIDLSCRLDVSGNRCDGTTGNAYSGTLTMSRQ